MADNDNRYSRRDPSDRSLRASDQDRAAVGDILRREHVSGRIDADEFADRFGRCLQARTYADLDALVTDLPVEEPAAGRAGPPASWPARTGLPGGPGWASRSGWRPWRAAATIWLAVAVGLLLFSGGHLFWVGFPLFFFFFVRPMRCGGGWGPARRWRRWDEGGPWVA